MRIPSWPLRARKLSFGPEIEFKIHSATFLAINLFSRIGRIMELEFADDLPMPGTGSLL
jgi:hypothetical protein